MGLVMNESMTRDLALGPSLSPDASIDKIAAIHRDATMVYNCRIPFDEP